MVDTLKHSEQIYKAKSHDYCFVVPVINEGERIQAQLKQMAKFAHLIDIIVADGGSSDGSLGDDFLKSCDVTAKLIKDDVGKLSAQLRMAYKFALDSGYKGIVTIDGNGKDSVESVVKFIHKLDEGFDFVQGSRYADGGEAINTPKIRELAVRLIHIPLISHIAGFKFSDTTNGYRAYSAKYLNHESVQPFRAVFDTYELLAYLSVKASQLGLKVCEVGVSRRYPSDGQIPTKISSFRGNFKLMEILYKLWRGEYEV